MQLETYISDLLYRYECVTIPEFGAFLTQPISATIDEASNAFYPPKKVLSSILHELENCSRFYISVAFITTSGVATIINTLKELEYKEIKGEIIVSQYLNFTQPEALKRLLQFNNIDLRIATTGNAHSKGYIFKNNEHYNLIVGSSNLTAQALSVNKEWNIKISALEQSGIVNKVLGEFYSDFEKGIVVTEDYISSYEKIYQNQFLVNRKNEPKSFDEPQEHIRPNSMQIEALDNLRKLRANQKNKALIISATGTGKTYLSAFDAKVFNPKRLLFVVHRLTIAQSSLITFRKVFGEDKTMGLYSGNRQDLALRTGLPRAGAADYRYCVQRGGRLFYQPRCDGSPP